MAPNINNISIIAFITYLIPVWSLLFYIKPLLQQKELLVSPNTLIKTTEISPIIEHMLYLRSLGTSEQYKMVETKDKFSSNLYFNKKENTLPSESCRKIHVAHASSSTSNETKTNKFKIPIRFINYRGQGSEKIVYAEPGANILSISDEYAINIPRQCRSGLCGTCTSDIQDPTWNEGERVGYQTIRACQAVASLPKGCKELVIDCYRMSNDSLTVMENLSSAQIEPNEINKIKNITEVLKVMEKDNRNNKTTLRNFEDGWEKEFQVTYKKRNSSNDNKLEKKEPVNCKIQYGEKDQKYIDSGRFLNNIGMSVPPWENIYL